MSKGWALAGTAAVSVASPATPPNMAAKPTVTLTRPNTVISPHARTPDGAGRCWTPATASRANPATTARSAANHRTGASRNPNSMATKHAPQTAVTHSIRSGLGRRSATASLTTGTLVTAVVAVMAAAGDRPGPDPSPSRPAPGRTGRVRGASAA
jgi:hypothetical protein